MPEDHWLDWLAKVYALHQVRASAIGLIFAEFDRLLLAGDFAKADAAMDAIELGRISDSMMFSVLTVTLPFRDLLERRQDFVGRVDACLRLRSPSLVDALLAGLR